MKKIFFWIFGLMIFMSSCSPKSDGTYALIKTNYGDMKIKLYDTTPLHRDNFVKLANEGFYDGLLFHRIIKGFMIQGGDPNSRNAPSDQALGAGGPGYQIDAEIGHLHFRGALAAARNGNPQKRSSGSQFYIVQGTPQNEMQLQIMENRGGFKYSEAQKQKYLKDGGTPQLDNDYTVFGELVEGFDVLDQIAGVETQSRPKDRPVEDVVMEKISIIK